MKIIIDKMIEKKMETGLYMVDRARKYVYLYIRKRKTPYMLKITKEIDEKINKAEWKWFDDYIKKNFNLKTGNKKREKKQKKVEKKKRIIKKKNIKGKVKKIHNIFLNWYLKHKKLDRRFIYNIIKHLTLVRKGIFDYQKGGIEYNYDLYTIDLKKFKDEYLKKNIKNAKIVMGKTYGIKDKLKKERFKWNGDYKFWYKNLDKNTLKWYYVFEVIYPKFISNLNKAKDFNNIIEIGEKEYEKALKGYKQLMEIFNEYDYPEGDEFFKELDISLGYLKIKDKRRGKK
ncbi:MAG: hypothetical protein B6I28_05145 [Fusobacteriia bacterium 4572_132]|nr:MAG: hypothetical protein B6I28_05145 [Fusobacteriia bacterium 4572_132]